MIPVVDLLRCPRCGAELAVDGRSLRCPQRHTYDIAKQGYVNLLGASPPAHADSAAMVRARAELLSSGRYDVVGAAVLAAVPGTVGTLLDVGTGTGYYAAAVLDTLPAARGLGVDVSVAACRRAARAHSRLGVITADVWQTLPIAGAAIDLVLSAFSPRNAEEFVRVLRPGGSVITVTPRPDHLAELRATLGLLGVEIDKEVRLAEVFERAGLTMIDQQEAQSRDRWSLADAVRSIAMGPNAFHRAPEQIRREAEQLDWPRRVTVSCLVTRWQR